MGLELSQLHNLLATPLAAIHVEYLPKAVAEYLCCPLAIGYLSSASLRHILKKHNDITLLDLLCLPEMIKTGTWIPDRAGHACVIYHHPETGYIYKSAIKATAGGYETYICTFHRIGIRQRESILRRAKPLL